MLLNGYQSIVKVVGKVLCYAAVLLFLAHPVLVFHVKKVMHLIDDNLQLTGLSKHADPDMPC